MATEGREAPAPPEVLAEIQDVIAKAKTGDATVLPQLRAILDRNATLTRHYGDLARHADAAWIALASGPNLYLKETLTREAESRRAELTRPGATPVEQLLVERVVACGLQLNYLTAAEADALGAGDSYRLVDHRAKRVERAQRMFLSATGALVTYQKLVPVAHVVAERTTQVLPTPTKSEQTAESPPVATVVGRVLVEIDGVELDDARPEPRDRLRVDVAC